MDVQSISPTKAVVSAGPDRVNTRQPVEMLRHIGEEPHRTVEEEGNALRDRRANRIRQRVQPLNTSPKTIEPIDFHDGVIGTFINEMDLLQTRMLAPGEKDSPQSLDALA